jgi:hypothetical protein
MLLSEIITDMRGKLFDPAPGVGWSNTDLIGYVNEALRATANVKPDMYTIQAFVPVVTGNTQQIPDDGVALLDIDQNETGRVVTQVDDALLDEANRFWPRATQVAEVQHYSADPRAPRRFKVFPPNNGAGSIQILYGAVHPALTALTDTILVPDSYQYALTCHALSQAWSKASKRQDPQKAQAMVVEWAQAIGMKSKAQVAVAPKVSVSEGAA